MRSCEWFVSLTTYWFIDKYAGTVDVRVGGHLWDISKLVHACVSV